MQLNSVAAPKLNSMASPMTLSMSRPSLLDDGTTAQDSLSDEISDEGIQDVDNDIQMLQDAPQQATEDDQVPSGEIPVKKQEEDPESMSDEELETAVDEMIGEVMSELIEDMKADMDTDEFNVTE